MTMPIGGNSPISTPTFPTQGPVPGAGGPAPRTPPPGGPGTGNVPVQARSSGTAPPAPRQALPASASGTRSGGALQAMNPLAQNPTVGAFSNLGHTMAPNVPQAVNHLDGKMQANQMLDAGNGLAEFGQAVGADMTHETNANAVGSMHQAANSAQTSMAQELVGAQIANTLKEVGLVTAGIKALSKSAESAAQSIGG